MVLFFRKVIVFVRCQGIWMDMVNYTAKWSDKQGSDSIVSVTVLSELVIVKSRVWPALWVGPQIS